MPRVYSIALPMLFAATSIANAAEMQTGAAPTAASEAAAETRAWLELQRSGRAGAPARSTSGAVASRAYQRYLDSFEHPLPAFFERESTGSVER